MDRSPTTEHVHPRAHEVLAALSERERLAFLHQHQPEVPRLGLQAFHTGTEVLHGLAWLGEATVFPQPVGLAATWDAGLIERVGRAVAAEVLAAHRRNPSVSRNVWAPVVDPLRHPSWGRNEEGWSEDPHLTGLLATAYAQGLRGGAAWLTVPTLKHVLGYNNEDGRAQTSTSLRPRVLREYELPAFLEPLRAGVAGALMPAYNLINGRPAHVCAEILEELRVAAPHPLLVVSDAYAPTNLADSQRYFADHASSHAAALRAGVDSFTDQDDRPEPTIERVREALERGLITMSDVDRAVLRVLHVRAILGDLDLQDGGEESPAPYGGGESAGGRQDEVTTQIDAPEHRRLAREAATASVVLLRNDGVLPLSGGERLAIVGPMSRRVLTDWYSGTPPYTVSLAQAMREHQGPGSVVVAEGDDRVVLRSLSTGSYVRRAEDGVLVADAADPQAGSATAWTDWGDGVATLTDAASGLLWSAQSHGAVTALATRVGGWEVQESFAPHRHHDGSWSFQHIGSGRWLRVRSGVATLAAEAADVDGAERFVLHHQLGGLAEVRAAVEDSDVTVVALGNDPHLHGRETADRPHLRLPEPQAEILRAATAAGKPVILAIISSYPYVLDAAARSSAAILWSSHGGQELGHAIADVLTGVTEPRGRLAQAWPESEADAGDILDYDIIAGRSTYWYSRKEPLFAFGHGLSWSTAELTAVLEDGGVLDLTTPAAGAEIALQVTVRNTGSRAMREVVQVYTDSPGHPLPYPRRLATWAAVEVPAGQNREVTVRFPTAQLAIWDVRADRFAILSGEYRVLVGRSAAEIHAALPLRVRGEKLAPRSLGSGVRAENFDDQDGVVLSDLTPEAGSCIEVAPGRARGTAVFDDVETQPHARLEVARRSSGPARVSLEVRAEEAMPWRSVGEVEPPPGGPYDWSPVAVELPAGPPLQLRLVLHGAVRVARIYADQ